MQSEVRALRSFKWQDDAACRNAEYDSRWWFPEKGGRTPLTDRAKEICRQCPVRFPCLTYGTQYSEHGIWGGLSEEQRREFRKVIRHHKPLVCQQCREEFLVPAASLGHSHMYCSDRCRHAASRERRGRA